MGRMKDVYEEDFLKAIGLVKYKPVPRRTEAQGLFAGESYRPEIFYLSPAHCNPKCKTCGFKGSPDEFEMALVIKHDLMCPNCMGNEIYWRFGSYVHNTYWGNRTFSSMMCHKASAIMELIRRHRHAGSSVLMRQCSDWVIGYKFYSQIESIDRYLELESSLTQSLPGWRIDRPIIVGWMEVLKLKAGLFSMRDLRNDLMDHLMENNPSRVVLKKARDPNWGILSQINEAAVRERAAGETSTANTLDDLALIIGIASDHLNQK
ncbi:MAG: hypothetical protein R3B38_00290 [Patescibacteria group bacterium]